MNAPRRILVTGATGYVGGRLAPLLLEDGHTVRCMVRDPDRLAGRPWANRVEIVRGDVLDADTLPGVLEGIDTAYYLIHSLHAGEASFAERDRQGARNFGAAARAAGVRHIIYLGGIAPRTDRPSPHLQSRLETGDCLRESGVTVTELRAGVIIGSGSLSFELIRYLTERVPVMICPRWVTTRTQPIAIRNVLDYLRATPANDAAHGRIIDIGSPDVLTYEDMFRLYAKVRGLRRLIVKVPVLTPRLSSYWIGLVTPLPAHVGRLLIDGLKNEVVCHDDTARRLYDVEPMGVEEAMRRALDRSQSHAVETTWFGAFSASGKGGEPPGLAQVEGMIVERRVARTTASPDAVFDVIRRLGGDTGWLYANALWKLRGLLDALVGGVGFRRGRRHPVELHVGEAVDFWRVEAVEPGRLLRLRAEMRVPGRAWLQFEVSPEGTGSRVEQTAFFEPRGLSGLLYWYVLYPAHRIIFRGMTRALVRRAEANATTPRTAEAGA
ncbi:MAG: NAD-dependent epimerase [Rhodothermaceae bacterium]|nr:MAG: NAD-dependent epimerase [Rhodothermaceae bacterium]